MDLGLIPKSSNPRNFFETILSFFNCLIESSVIRSGNLLKLNCGKAKKVLKWSSVLSFNENIKMTMEWYKNYYNSKNLKQMKKFSENQIKEFIKLAKKRSKK